MLGCPSPGKAWHETSRNLTGVIGVIGPDVRDYTNQHIHTCVYVCARVCSCSLWMSIRLGLPDVEWSHTMRPMYVYVSSQAIHVLSLGGLGPRSLH